MKFLIVGLGNIGSEYEGTRHNIGFSVVEKLAFSANRAFANARYASHCEIKHKGKTFVLIKPSTYMNLSGNAVRYWMLREKIPIEQLLVVTDDLALPFGKLRMRASGSDGGHNGLTSINETLGTKNFARLRFGIGNEFAKGQQAHYVLSRWSDDEMKLLGDRIDLAAKAVLSFAHAGISKTMTDFNVK